MWMFSLLFFLLTAAVNYVAIRTRVQRRIYYIFIILFFLDSTQRNTLSVQRWNLEHLCSISIQSKVSGMCNAVDFCFIDFRFLYFLNLMVLTAVAQSR